MSSTGVLVLLRGPLEPDVVAGIDRSTAGLRVVRRCADVAEALAAADAGLGLLAVIETSAPGVDRTVVARLARSHVRTVLLADDDDLPRAAGLGGAAVVAATGGTVADRVVEALRAVGEEALAPSGPDPTLPTLPTAVRRPVPGQDAPPEPLAGRPGGGGLVAVWGTHGAPGRSTVAVNVATELARAGESTLLVDADTTAPALSQVLGVLDESAGLAAACRAASLGTLDPLALSRWCPVLEPRLRFCSGLTRADRWRELAPAALDVVWRVARELARWVVVDCAAGLGDDGPRGFGAPSRAAATQATLAAADVVLVVGSADPVGVRRLVHAWSELEDTAAESGAQRRVVMTKLRPGAAGPRPADAVTEALVRFAGVVPAALVPDDRAALDGALMAGLALAEHAPRSPARVALRDVALGLLPPDAASAVPREGRRRRAVALTPR
ncbi:ATPase involved in chromosome partitioning [Beutenbergia cavernae DSM 12333]|uniref:ATPase involved in chromosome partitioning n=1 Tax=Beutenbergia cavernae (strain ATCC BAA-8 / DSM 12333 / CCUG 43141 / JCM 11478 / NBRC 16432 / NCIMB 13614 / HKI 0122) TaxID=471853 RepID=C5C1Q0_BEUC1|nr:chromosome partitioning ATPase [Beutenbergia cavernae]ACQ79518.1 ATPase involved in chromosome partitioning [Beutenbergia cavernae DSM 12333]